MTRLRHSLVISLLCVAALAPAAAASPGQVIQDCADDGQLSRDYSNRDLKGALGDLPSDLDEYSDCREIISGAISSGGGDKPKKSEGSGGGAADSAGPTPHDLAALEEAVGGPGNDGKPTLRIGGQSVRPGDNGLFDLANAANGLPGTLLAALIGLAVLALAGGLLALRRQVPALQGLSLASLRGARVRLPKLRR